MKVVMPVAIPELMRLRALTGADRFDEMWEGVHQTHASRLLSFFIEVWCPATGGAAVMQINVSSPERWDQDYRIPDVPLVYRSLSGRAQRPSLARRETFTGGHSESTTLK